MIDADGHDKVQTHELSRGRHRSLLAASVTEGAETRTRVATPWRNVGGNGWKGRLGGSRFGGHACAAVLRHAGLT